MLFLRLVYNALGHRKNIYFSVVSEGGRECIKYYVRKPQSHIICGPTIGISLPYSYSLCMNFVRLSLTFVIGHF